MGGLKEIKPAVHTAVQGEKCFEHFGISPVSASLYGHKEEEIIKVEVSVAEDQTEALPPQNDPKINEPDYWGWWDAKQEKFSLIWSKYFLLNMCFPYGMKVEEEAGKGKAYRVNVKKIEE
jgi:hypothetical protein